MSKNKRHNYTNKFKDEAVKLVREQGYSIAGAARTLSINANMLSRWKKEFEHPEDES